MPVQCTFNIAILLYGLQRKKEDWSGFILNYLYSSAQELPSKPKSCPKGDYTGLQQVWWEYWGRKKTWTWAEQVTNWQTQYLQFIIVNLQVTKRASSGRGLEFLDEWIPRRPQFPRFWRLAAFQPLTLRQRWCSVRWASCSTKGR